MSILETGKIDIVATKLNSNEVRLVVSDHLDWSDVEGHFSLLQDKINTYIAFVESGQLERTKEPPIPVNPKVIIVLAVPQEPTQEALKVLGEVKGFLASINIDFALEVVGPRWTPS
jgi:hypothetical protein